MKNVASFLALCIICTSLSVVNASNAVQGSSPNVSANGGYNPTMNKMAVLEITGFSAGNEQSTLNVVTGILSEYEHYGDLVVSTTSSSGVNMVVVQIWGPISYVLGALDFLSANKPQYLTINTRIQL